MWADKTFFYTIYLKSAPFPDLFGLKWTDYSNEHQNLEIYFLQTYNNNFFVMNNFHLIYTIDVSA